MTERGWHHISSLSTGCSKSSSHTHTHALSVSVLFLFFGLFFFRFFFPCFSSCSFRLLPIVFVNLHLFHVVLVPLHACSSSSSSSYFLLLLCSPPPPPPSPLRTWRAFDRVVLVEAIAAAGLAERLVRLGILDALQEELHVARLRVRQAGLHGLVTKKRMTAGQGGEAEHQRLRACAAEHRQDMAVPMHTGHASVPLTAAAAAGKLLGGCARATLANTPSTAAAASSAGAGAARGAMAGRHTGLQQHGRRAVGLGTLARRGETTKIPGPSQPPVLLNDTPNTLTSTRCGQARVQATRRGRRRADSTTGQGGASRHGRRRPQLLNPHACV